MTKSSVEEKLHIFMGRQIVGYLFVSEQDDHLVAGDLVKEEEK